MIFTRHTIPNAVRAAWLALYTLFSDEPVVATDEVHKARLKICKDCYWEVAGQCMKCTCMVELKTLMATEKCPVGRWGRQTKKSTGL